MKEFIVSIGYRFEGSDDLKISNKEAQRLGEIMRKAIDEAFANQKITAFLESTKFDHLEYRDMTPNARRCEQCTVWTTNWWEPKTINVLEPGCYIDGKWLCDQCIPDTPPKSELIEVAP